MLRLLNLSLALSLSLLSCATLPDPLDVENCTAYGVHRGTPMGPVREYFVLPTSEIQLVCTGNIGNNNHFVGCIYSNDDGTSTVYYQTDDNAAKNHETAHSVCGPHHTGRYIRDVMHGHARPYFPVN